MQEVFENIIKLLTQKENEAVLKAPNTGDIANAEYQKWMMKSYGFKEAIEIVKQEAEQCNNGWIPVSDHIPVPAKKSFGNKQKRTNVLVTLRNGLVKEMTFEFETNEFWEVGDDNHIEHWKEDAIDTDTEVVAWQPLPQPYQPKGE